MVSNNGAYSAEMRSSTRSARLSRLLKVGLFGSLAVGGPLALWRGCTVGGRTPPQQQPDGLLRWRLPRRPGAGGPLNSPGPAAPEADGTSLAVAAAPLPGLAAAAPLADGTSLAVAAAPRPGLAAAAPEPEAPIALRCIAGRAAAHCPPALTPPPPVSSTLAMCLQMRDESDMPEWLDHYRSLGVSFFYIFDHNATQPLWERAPHALTDDVHYQYFNEIDSPKVPQLAVYDYCIQQFAARHRWMAFFDADEFLILLQEPRSLPQLLEAYTDFGGLGVNWRLFGSSQHIHRPAGRVVDNYTQCYPADDDSGRHVKIIGNCRYLQAAGADPHTFEYRNDSFAVGENRERIDGAFSERISTEKVVLHHYVLKSWEDFRIKMVRAAAKERPKDPEFFILANAAATETCTQAVGHAASTSSYAISKGLSSSGELLRGELTSSLTG